MKILKFPLGQLQANCYFLIEEDNCLVIDPGDEAAFILEELQRRRLKLIGMLATHGHFDHIMAAGEIQASINVPLYINKKDKFLLDRTIETVEYFLGYKPTIIKPITVKYLTVRQLIINNYQLIIILSPGHTPGGCAFYFPNNKTIFTGDTLFKGEVGRYDFPYCSKKDLKNSLKKLSKLPKETVVHPGHGEETTIKEEKQNIDKFLNFLNS